MKNGNLYQEVKSAKKEERVANARYYNMVRAMEKELEGATKPIKDKYEPILKKLEDESFEKSGQVWGIAGTYRDYSSFFVRGIVNIFAVLLTYVEGEKYVPYRNRENHEINENSIIIKEDAMKQYDKIDYATIDDLYNNGDLIILQSGFSNIVNFYNNIGDPNYYFGQFNYLHEFLNRLIQYRIINDKKRADDITMENLYSFMCNFISTHPDLEQRNKDKREQMLIGSSEEESVVSECKKLEMKLKK